jgi:hypothetical protein
MAAGGAAAVVIAGRDIVAPADAGLGETLAAGRDMVDEADAGEGAAAPTAGRDPVAEAEAGAPAPTAGRDPVAEAEAGAAGRDPVAEADAGDIGFGAGLPAALAGVKALGAAEGAALAPAAGISVVPHCTQNFAPG